MVLRKMLEKFRSRNEPKKGSQEPDKSNSSKQQKQDGGYGGGDTKKKLKKVRSVRVADLDGLRKAPKKTDLPLSKSTQQTAEVPNYMKSTSSYDARTEKNKVTINYSTPPPTTTTSKPLSSAARDLVKNSSLKLLRLSMKKNKGKSQKSSMYTRRVTCSSTIEDSQTPKYVEHNEHHDSLALNICHYTYCSLHGEKHGAVPFLKRFLSARRNSLKVQKSIKLRGYSSIKKKGYKDIELIEDVVNEFFNEIHSKLQERGEDRNNDDAEIINRMNKMKLEYPNDASQFQESHSITCIEDCGDKNSEISMEDIQVINQFLEFIEKGCQEETQYVTEYSEQAESEAKLSNFLHSRHVNCNEAAIHEVCSQSQNDRCMSQSTIFANGSVKEVVNSSENNHLQANIVLPHPPQRPVEEDWATLETGCGERQKDISKADLNKFSVENNVKDCSSLASRPKIKYSKLRRQPTKFRRPPRLVELQAEPEQEQINLKHQTVDERKTSEEWMIDYTLRKALRRLASSRKRKVPLLVAAFETVTPQMRETIMCSQHSS